MKKPIKSFCFLIILRLRNRGDPILRDYLLVDFLLFESVKKLERFTCLFAIATFQEKG